MFRRPRDNLVQVPESNGQDTDIVSASDEIPADFDEDVYLQLNPDVYSGIEIGVVESGAEHWRRYGQSEHRLYKHACPTRDDFDEAGYLQLNPDVAYSLRAGGFRSGYDHWIQFGRTEGRIGGSWKTEATRPPKQVKSANLNPNIACFGFHSLSTGLGNAARSYQRAFESAGLRVEPIDVPAWHKNPMAQGILPPGEIPRHAINLIHQNGDMLPLFCHWLGSEALEDAYNIGAWVWEIPTVHPVSYAASRLLDEIWAPSEFCRHAFSPVSAVPVIRIPYAIFDKPGIPDNPRTFFNVSENLFVFLYVFDLGSTMERKNPLALVRAFRHAFGDSQDALLILKYWNSDSASHDREIQLLERQSSGANIRLLGDTLSEEAMSSLYRVADCFVSPHRAEGFGLNIAQSMYFGKPVIATGYSGNTDFTRADNSYLVEFALTSLPYTTGPYAQNGVWAEPSISHLAHLLKHVYHHRDEAAAKGRKGMELMRSDFSPESVGRQIRHRLEAAGLLR